MSGPSETLAAALVDALAELTNIAKGHEGGGGGKRYTYANIGDLVAETRPILAAHGLVALTSVHGFEGRLACTIELVHSSGEVKRFDPLPFPEGNDAQTTGSWMTYMRRYALLSALGMGTEDDDGAGAQRPERPAQRRSQPAPEPVVGITPKEAGDRVVEVLREAKVPDPPEHAKEVWRIVKPQAVEGLIEDDEVARLVTAAKSYAADIAALNA